MVFQQLFTFSKACSSIAKSSNYEFYSKILIKRFFCSNLSPDDGGSGWTRTLDLRWWGKCSTTVLANNRKCVWKLLLIIEGTTEKSIQIYSTTEITCHFTNHKKLHNLVDLSKWSHSVAHNPTLLTLIPLSYQNKLLLLLRFDLVRLG